MADATGSGAEDGASVEPPDMQEPRISLMALWGLLVMYHFAGGFWNTTKSMMKKEHFGGSREASLASSPFGSANHVLYFLLAQTWGVFSDSFGRCAALCLATVPTILSGASLTLLGTDGVPLYLVFGDLLVLGSVESISIAYIADATEGEAECLRTQALARYMAIKKLVGAAAGVSGGSLAGLRVERRLICLVSLLLFATVFAFALLRLPESLPRGRRARMRCALSAGPVGSARLLWDHRATIGLLCLAFALAVAAQTGEDDIVSQYLIWRFGFDDLSLALYSYSTGLLVGAVNLFLAGPAIRRFGPEGVAVSCLATEVVLYLTFAFAPGGRPGYPFAFICSPLFALGSMWRPAFLTLLLRDIDASGHGAFQGALGALGAVVTAPVPMVFAAAFAATRYGNPGLPWLIAAALHALAISLSLRHVWLSRVPEPEHHAFAAAAERDKKVPSSGEASAASTSDGDPVGATATRDFCNHR